MTRREAAKYIEMGATPRWVEIQGVSMIPARFASALTQKNVWIPDNVIKALAERWGISSEKDWG